MLPDLSPTHIMIVVVVALIVVGPKDLPMLLRKVGQFMARMRGMANEFRASFDEMARQSELDDLRREVETMREAASRAAPQLNLNDPFKTASHGEMLDHWLAADEGSSAPAPLLSSIAPPEAPPAVAAEADPAPAKASRKRTAKRPAAPSIESEA